MFFFGTDNSLHKNVVMYPFFVESIARYDEWSQRIASGKLSLKLTAEVCDATGVENNY